MTTEKEAPVEAPVETPVETPVEVPDAKRIKLDNTENAGESVQNTAPRFKKSKVAMLMGYAGTNYSGMQYNRDSPTIEKVLFEAFAKVNAVSESNSDSLQKVQFQRSCRTDKKVHAARQVVSFKCQRLDEKEKLIAELNASLPSDIRIFDVIRTTNNFNSHISCGSRIYEYLMPTFILEPLAYNDFQKMIQDKIEMYRDKSEEESIALRAEEVSNQGQCPPEVVLANEKFRVSQDTLEAFRANLKRYVGTKSFHNFTVKGKYSPASLKRHIMDFTCSEPFIESGKEWVSIKVHGQSFMMHQIRKMIGLAALVVRSNAPADKIFALAFGNERLNIPKSPGEGLFLYQPNFDGYNKKVQDSHSLLTFDNCSSIADKFEKEVIYPEIYKLEKQLNCYYNWLQCIEEHAFEYPYFLEEFETIENYKLNVSTINPSKFKAEESVE